MSNTSQCITFNEEMLLSNARLYFRLKYTYFPKCVHLFAVGQIIQKHLNHLYNLKMLGRYCMFSMCLIEFNTTDTKV